MIVTGPNRDIFKGTSFKFIYAFPGGNTMMTGPMELVKAAQYRFGQIANRTCLPQAGIEKSKIPSLHPPPLGDRVVMAGRGQRASFGSFRIAIILRLWVTVLTVENGVCMVNKPMILFPKRFRSKAPLAASLLPGQFVDRPGTGCDFLPAPYCDTVSGGRGGG